MAPALAVTALFLLFVATFVLAYRHRFPINPVRTERWAMGVALSVLALALAALLLALMVTRLVGSLVTA